MKIIVPVQYGVYHCGECGQALKFEPTPMRDGTSFAIGYCDSGHECYDEQHMKGNCKRFNVRVRIPIQLLECEVVEP